ncbi:hypothetical protein Lal_00034016 [Lupinus albus]|nr:hypothetical protein Lal_00034016 [Lupinus albus]
MSISDNVKPSMTKMINASEFMRMIKEYAHSNIIDKSLVGNLMVDLTTKKFDWSQPIHDHEPVSTSGFKTSNRNKGKGEENIPIK